MAGTIEKQHTYGQATARTGMRYTSASMARGWESKAVEEQRTAAEPSRKRARATTPEEQEKARKREELELARKRALADLAAARNPRHRELLERTVAALNERIRALDGESR